MPQDRPDAQNALGSMYAKGFGTEANEMAAISWWERAAMQGQPIAQYRLACAYLEGWPVKKDMAKGLKWLSRSAASGTPEALDLLQKIPSEHRGVR